MAKILTTLDGSELSEAILPKVAELTNNGDTVTLLMIVEPSSDLTHFHDHAQSGPLDSPGAAAGIMAGGQAVAEPPGGVHNPESRDQMINRLRDSTRDYLDDKAAVITASGASVTTEVVLDDEPVNAIVNASRKLGANMIAMSTHGRSGLRGLVQGSVTRDVINAGVAPVLVFHPGH